LLTVCSLVKCTILSIAQKFTERFRVDEEVKKRLAKLLILEALLKPGIRLSTASTITILKDVATKDDIAKLREEVEKIRIETRKSIAIPFTI